MTPADLDVTEPTTPGTTPPAPRTSRWREAWTDVVDVAAVLSFPMSLMFAAVCTVLVVVNMEAELGTNRWGTAPVEVDYPVPAWVCWAVFFVAVALVGIAVATRLPPDPVLLSEDEVRQRKVFGATVWADSRALQRTVRSAEKPREGGVAVSQHRRRLVDRAAALTAAPTRVALPGGWVADVDVPPTVHERARAGLDNDLREATSVIRHADRWVDYSQRDDAAKAVVLAMSAWEAAVAPYITVHQPPVAEWLDAQDADLTPGVAR